MVEPVYRYNSAIVRRPARSVVHGLRADDRGDPTFEQGMEITRKAMRTYHAALRELAK